MNDFTPVRGRSRTRWIAALAALVIVVAAVIAIVVATRPSSSASPGVANVGPTPTATATTAQGGTSTQNKAAAYSSCMRSHGVPNFPDPDSQGRIMMKYTKSGSQSSGIDPNSAQYKAAAQACKKLAPKQTTSEASSNQLSAQMLKYAQCIRAHGVPNFPDPQVSGGRVMMVLPKGINQNSPQFQSAQQACRSLAPGGGPGSGQ